MNIAIDRRFMMRHPAHVIAMGFGAGLSLWAPGTVGTLWAWASFVVLHLYFDAVQLAWLIGLSLPLGWWASTVTARNLGVSDPGNIVWDEIVAAAGGFLGPVLGLCAVSFFRRRQTRSSGLGGPLVQRLWLARWLWHHVR